MTDKEREAYERGYRDAALDAMEIPHATSQEADAGLNEPAQLQAWDKAHYDDKEWSRGCGYD